MTTIHMPESEAASNFAAVLAHVRAGSEVVIESNASAVAVVIPPSTRPGILLSEVIARAEARGSAVTLDEGFGRDLEDAIASHRDEGVNPPAWEYEGFSA